MGRGTPRAVGFEGQQGLNAGAPQDWGKQKLHSWSAHTVSCTLGPRAKAVTSQECRPDLPAGLGGSPGEAGGSCISPWGCTHWGRRYW